MKNFKILLTILCSSLILNSCVYYNTFYNAKKYFNEAREIQKNNDGKISGAAITKYTKASKKCGAVLEFYKDSKYVDDALYMLARCLYYKRNYIQAEKNFEKLIEIFPNSEFYSDSKIFIAKCRYKLNNIEAAEEILNAMLIDSKYSKKKPEILLLIANKMIENEDYVLAEPYLKNIIENFQKSDQYEEAYIQLGNIYLKDEDYESSLEIFNKIKKLDFSKAVTLDAEYYIGLNNFMLEKYQKSLEICENLIKKEFRDNEFAKVELLKARSLQKTGQFEDAVSLFKRLIKDNKRTELSAEASYYLGEVYFRNLNKYEDAIDAYAQVKKEKRNSEFLEKALTKKTIVSQIVQLNNDDTELSTDDLIKHSLRLAEYYIDELNKPDSAFVVYENLKEQKSSVSAKVKELKLEFEEFPTPETKKDSLKFKDLKSNFLKAQQDLELFNQEYIPFTHFIKAWIYKDIRDNSELAEAEYEFMNEKFPDNKYTYAAQRLINNQKVVIGTPEYLELRKKFDNAVKLEKDKPKKTIELLKELQVDKFPKLEERKKFTLGYLYYFELRDSTEARPYFNNFMEKEILTPEESEYKNFIQKFYDGTHFTVIEELPYLTELKKEMEKNEEEKSDKKKNGEKADSE